MLSATIEHIVILIAIEESVVDNEIIHLRYCFGESWESKRIFPIELNMMINAHRIKLSD